MIKKLLIGLGVAFLLFFTVDGCKSKRGVVSGKVVDKEFIPAHYNDYTTTDKVGDVYIVHHHHDYVPDWWGIEVQSELLLDTVEVSHARFDKTALLSKVNYVRYSGYFTGIKWWSYVVDLEQD